MSRHRRHGHSAASEIARTGLALEFAGYDFRLHDHPLFRVPAVSDLFRLSRWKPRHLLAAWSAYWVGLVAVTLGPAIVSIVRVAAPADAKADVAANYGDGALHLVVNANGAPLFSGTATVVTIALWLSVPPLLLWLAWAVARPARNASAPNEGPLAPRMLGESTPSLHDREKAPRQTVDRD
jgi:hypothetical protein